MDEAQFFHSLGLQTPADRTNDDFKSSEEPGSSSLDLEGEFPRNVWSNSAPQDTEMSFIDAIGLYWLNPATDKAASWAQNQGHAVDGATAENTDNLGDTRGLEHLGDTGVLENLGDTRGLANLGDNGDLENLGDTAELDKLSEDPNCRELEELDFLSMLGLTKVEPPGRRWRLWHPEDEGEVVLGGENLLASNYVDTDPTLMEDLGKRILEDKENEVELNQVKEKTKQFLCEACNKSLSSQVMLSRHLDSELHFNNSRPRSDVTTRSSRPRSDVTTRRRTHKPRLLGQSSAQKNEPKKNILHHVKDENVSQAPGNNKEETRRGIVECESCGTKVQVHQMPKHLISHYHYHRSIGHPSTERLILENVAGIVKQSPFQCHPCQFYCNWHRDLVAHVENHQAEGIFWCIICIRVMHSQEELCDHLRSEDHLELISVINRSVPTVIKAIDLVPCTLCSRQFRLNVSLKKHMQTDHGVVDFQLSHHQKFQCEFCEYWSYKQSSLHTHAFIVHPKKDLKYKCNFCRKEFRKLEHIQQHRNSLEHKEAVDHFKNPVVPTSRQCTLCVQQFSSVEQLKAHLETSHIGLLPQCTLCGKLFHFPQQLKGHLKKKCKSISGISPPPGNHQCDICEFSSDSEVRLQRHIKFRHKELKVHCEIFKCENCFRPFSCRELLENHCKKFHSVAEVLTCSFSGCSYSSSKSKLFKNHVKRTHSQTQELHPCDECEKAYQSAASLKNHKASAHTPIDNIVRSFNCDFKGCDFNSSFQSDLERHKLKHSDLKSIFCTSCDYSCKRKSELSRHFKLKHEDTSPQQCSVCEYKTKNSSHMKRHMKRHNTPVSSITQTEGFGLNIDPENIIVIPLDSFEEQIVV